jgi:hypothetical protein
MKRATLIMFAGLPATGKSSIPSGAQWMNGDCASPFVPDFQGAPGPAELARISARIAVTPAA